MAERWVVISNCQTTGLASSIETLARDVSCEGCDNLRFAEIVAVDPDYFKGFDRALVLPKAKDWPGFDAARLPEQSAIPAVQFSAYHPDCVYVMLDGRMFSGGVIGAYHSMIALAAYKEGLDAERAAAFFADRVYRAAGYDRIWDAQRRWLIDLFAGHGLDIAAAFPGWGRRAPFMHTVNHPRIRVMHDIARAVLTAHGKDIFADAPPPPDTLASLTWPVYPEIGERLGVAGSYLFQTHAAGKPMTLVAYLAASLAAFAPYDRSRLRVIPSQEKWIKRIRRIMRGEDS